MVKLNETFKKSIFYTETANLLNGNSRVVTKSASTPIDTEKPLLKDPDGEDVDIHTYRSMIGPLMYLTSSRPDIMFAGKPHLGLWYPKDSPFNLVAYSNSDYAGASLDRKSTTGGCQFLSYRLISWQCKKQTVVATLLIEAEYVAAASYCAQVLWIQNQLLDYGPDQTVSGKDSSNLLMADNVPKIVWYLTHHVALMKSWLVQKQTTLGKMTTALIDKKKMIITEDTVRQALRLDDAESNDCLPNEEIFTELARMGYEKPSTKLTFYKAFFSAQWKFFIHTIIQCMSAKRTTWNKFSSSMASAVICLATVGDLSSHTIKYASPVLTQKVFANMRRVGKGFYEDATEPTLPSPTPPSPQELPSTLQVAPTPPSSPIAQPSSPPQQQQPSHDAAISMDLLNTILENCTTLTRKVEALKQDKVAQSLEIIKLKQHVRILERKNKLKVSGLRRLKKGRIIADLDADKNVILEEVDAAKDAKIEKNTDVQGRLEESQAQVYHIDLEHVDKVLSMQDDEREPAELKDVIGVVTVAKLMTEVVTVAATTTASIITTAPSAAKRRKGVVIRDPEETATPSTIVHSKQKSKDKGKGILVEEPKPLKKSTDRGKQANAVLRYQALKRKLQIEAQAKKNMMVYLKNMASFKMDFFRGMSYDDIRSIFEKYFNSNVAFLEKSKEELEEEANSALKRKTKSSEQQATKKQNLDKEIVQEIFSSSKPKNFSDDFLLTTLKAMFEKPDVEAQMILLVERRYPLTRFTLEQMLNNVRLEVEEESEASLELLRFVRRQQQEGYRPDFGVDAAEDFKEYTLRDYYYWLKTYNC
uniref:Uncharacterized mitochondrial protein AtMg00810-like n=1 Tax=Tanacetum cinerariifolium TaxID=118510 RepID=A0A6L2KLI3_TANCI|nr:uncharacterized mitochondrial protein AtMg00810-like [Tanacetum cinerariifolium]